MADRLSGFEPGEDIANVAIPRPAFVMDGPSPTWVEIDKDLRASISFDNFYEWIRFQIESSQDNILVPPQSASYSAEFKNGQESDAAVLVAITSIQGKPSFLLTRRTIEMKNHSGQVSFCGGRREPGENPIETALREAAEEVGLPSKLTKVHGTLTPISTISRNATIVPVLASLDELPQLTPNKYEVARIFTASISELWTGTTYHSETWRRENEAGEEINVHFFDIEGETIWGATARIIVSLLESLAKVL